MRALLAFALLTTACAKTPTTPAATPAATPTATPPAATPAANKCTQAGGHCSPKVATNACAKFEEGPDWGCGADDGCCM